MDGKARDDRASHVLIIIAIGHAPIKATASRQNDNTKDANLGRFRATWTKETGITVEYVHLTEELMDVT